jgi:hypothetical protein
MHPNFVGLGAARAGSTWIARNLMQHPDIFLPSKKELHYFDRHYEKGLTYYQQEFSEWSGERVVGEITPQYFHNEAVAPLIKEQFPDIKLFVCLRNPVQRAYSHYWRLVAVSSGDRQASFEEVLRTTEEVLDVGCYHDHLTRYLRYFKQQQILVLIFDDLEANPQAFLNNMYVFLDVENMSSTFLAQQRINAAASHQDLGRSKVLWYLYRAFSRLRMFRLSSRLEKINSRELQPMKPETKEFLIDYYSVQVKKLQDLIDRDLSSWLI